MPRGPRAKAPPFARLEGDRVVLRPFRPDEAEAWWEARRGTPEREQPAGVPTLEDIERRVSASGRLEAGRLDLAMEADGRLVGEISTFWPQGRKVPAGVFELGIGIWEEADRFQGRGREAIALLTTWLFEHAGARRVEASTARDNGPMRRVLEKLGFGPAGTSEWADREWVIYAITRAAWAAIGRLRSPSPGRRG